MTSSSSVDGLVSGLQTSQIISQLMQVEAAPQTMLKNKEALEKVTVQAYQSVNSQMASVLTAAQALTSNTLWNSVKVTSSDTSVTASTSMGAKAGSLTFDVTGLAAGEVQLSNDTYSSLNASALSGSSLTFTKSDGSTVTVTPTDSSLGAVVSAVNNQAGLGVKAAAVALGNGTYALQLNSTSTGAAASFSVSGLSSALTESSKAADATISIGTGTTAAHVITSSTNTFTNVLPGLTFTVSAVKTGVNLSLASDSSAPADAVQKLVDAANAALDGIAGLTAYDPDKKQAAPLTGDYTVRQLQQQILSAVTSGIGGNQSASSAGISVTRDGHLSFDRSVFTTAYDKDPQALQQLVGATGSFTPTAGATYAGGMTLLTSTQRTQEAAGGHSITVTTAATRSTATIDVGTLDTTSQVTLAGVTVTAAAGDTADTFTAKLNAALSTKGYTASLSGSTVTLSSVGYGASSAFTPTVAGSGLTATGTTKGTDVVGTIDGKLATGTGQVLSGQSGTSADGLALLVTLTPADVAQSATGASGAFNFTAGVAQKLALVANGATDSVTGMLTSAINSHNATIKGLDDDIADWDLRLAAKQQALQLYYSNLEVSLGKLKDQSNWLAGQLASLPSGSN
ncbi:MAG: flagellar filament capping protein FliD [Actinomycetes bacterium]